MKTWLAKFRISAALDRAGAKPTNPLCPGAESAEIKRFAASMHSLDRRLKTAPPVPVPEDLHASVMRAVRTASRVEPPRSVSPLVRWVPASAVALLLVLALWQPFIRPSQDSVTLAAAATALEQGQQFTHQAPSAVLAPLAAEMGFLNRDLQDTIEFLVASVP